MNKAQRVISLCEQMNESFVTNLAGSLASGAHALGTGIKKTTQAGGQAIKTGAEKVKQADIGGKIKKATTTAGTGISKAKDFTTKYGAQALNKGKELGKKARFNVEVARTAGKFNVGQSKAGQLLKKVGTGAGKAIKAAPGVTKKVAGATQSGVKKAGSVAADIGHEVSMRRRYTKKQHRKHQAYALGDENI